MKQLAVCGGNPVRVRPFASWPVFDEREAMAVQEVVKSGKWWRYSFGEGLDFHHPTGTDPSNVAQFQKEFAAYQGLKYAVACNNGTTALDILLKALGIGPGDEVIVPGYTYVAGVTCVLQVNAVPVFVDVCPDTYNIDPDKIEEAVTERTVAIVLCHFGGQLADMDRIMKISKKYNLAVIEDAAHAHGSKWDGKGAGSIGHGGTFSFQNAKNMTSGEGGLISTNDADTAERIESLTWSGRKKGRPWYEFYELGWNARMTEVQGAMLRVQLTRLEEQNRKRRENAFYLNKRLEEIPGVDPVLIKPKGAHYSVHIYMIRYRPQEFNELPREKYLEALNAEGIPAFSGYTHPVYKNPMFLEKKFYTKGCPVSCTHYHGDIDYRSFEALCPVSERAASYEAIWLDHRLFLGNSKDMDDIAEAMQKIKENVNELKK